MNVCASTLEERAVAAEFTKVKEIELPGHRYILERINKGYMLYHQTDKGIAKIAIERGAMRELGSAMLVEGATRDFVEG